MQEVSGSNPLCSTKLYNHLGIDLIYRELPAEWLGLSIQAILSLKKEFL